jgi:glycerol-3-phosphate acyltransferase PlsY
MNTDFNKLCSPAKLYFALSVLSCIIMLFNRMSLLSVFSKLIFAFLWTFVLGWICNKGYKSISWFLVLLPFIMLVLVSFGIMRHVREINKLNPMVN